MVNHVISPESEIKIEAALSRIRNLPALPNIIFEVDAIIQNPVSSASQLSKVISKDQGLSTKILSVANSPLFGFPRRVATIDFAIVVLGFNHIKNIVSAFAILETCSSYCDGKFNQKQFGLHSIMTATASRRIAMDLGLPNTGEAFTAGLLHDLGIPIICRYFKKDYSKILDLANDEGMSIYDAEERALGFHHNQIGAKLIEKWNLPSSLSEVIMNHHLPSGAENYKQLTAIVHLADYMTNYFQLGDFNWDFDYVLDEEITAILRLGNAEYLENLIQSYKQLFENQINLITI